MATAAETFFANINTLQDISALVGTTEDSVFDCKEWFGKDQSKKSIAKAACGFTNATGGVIIIGLSARKGRDKDQPDLVDRLVPVKYPDRVVSEVLDLILSLVEPGVEGVQNKVILDADGEQGFALFLVPESDGAVRRSKADWRFYVRVASGTLPMEYFQVEERFGRRPRPSLEVILLPYAMQEGVGEDSTYGRGIDVFLKNTGRGIARFPALNIVPESDLTLTSVAINGRAGAIQWPIALTPIGEIAIRGGADAVVYPGETFIAGRLIQTATLTEKLRPYTVDLGFHFVDREWLCAAREVQCTIYCEGMIMRVQRPSIAEESVVAEPKQVFHGEQSRPTTRYARGGWMG